MYFLKRNVPISSQVSRGPVAAQVQDPTNSTRHCEALVNALVHEPTTPLFRKFIGERLCGPSSKFGTRQVARRGILATRDYLRGPIVILVNPEDISHVFVSFTNSWSRSDGERTRSLKNAVNLWDAGPGMAERGRRSPLDHVRRERGDLPATIDLNERQKELLNVPEPDAQSRVAETAEGHHRSTGTRDRTTSRGTVSSA